MSETELDPHCIPQPSTNGARQPTTRWYGRTDACDGYTFHDALALSCEAVARASSRGRA